MGALARLWQSHQRYARSVRIAAAVVAHAFRQAVGARVNRMPAAPEPVFEAPGKLMVD